MSSRSPSTRWNKEHGHGKRRRVKAGGKRIYQSWWKARFSAWRLNKKYQDTLQVYSCHWGANYRDGETAEMHWHLGHPSADDMWGY